MAKRLQVLLHNVDPDKLDVVKRGEDKSYVRSSLTFPINPENITDTHARYTSEVKLLDDTYGYAVKEKKARKFSIKCTLPEKDFILSDLSYLFYTLNYKPYAQGEAKKLLNTWWENQTLLRFMVDDDINFLCHISSYSFEIYENTPDITCTIELVESFKPAANESSENDPKETLGFPRLRQRIGNRIKPDNEIVAQQGQTIYKIAKLYYGGKFMELAKLNGLENALNKDISGMVINFGLDKLDGNI